MDVKNLRSTRVALIGLTVGLLWCSWAGGRNPQPITILHWNDFHAQNLPWETEIEGVKVEVGGAAYLAGLLDSLRLTEPRAIALHAGDEFTGMPVSSFTQGESQIEILNEIKPDAFELGNHEFDYGWAILQKRMAEAEFPILCCNVFDSTTGQPIARSSLILVRDGVKIGVIGVVTGRLRESVRYDALPGLRVEDPVGVVNSLLDELEELTDIQVALTHQGVEEDKRLAKGCPRLDVIVGGHRHVTLFEPLVENRVPILQAGSKGEYLGIFQADVDTASNHIVSYTGKLVVVVADSIRPRQEVAELVEKQEKLASADMDRVIGRLTTPWVRSDEGESNVGDWTADAMIKLTGKDIAFINSGGFRKDLPAGPVTVGDIWELHPFGDQLYSFKISGEELRKLISLQAKSDRPPLQVGGLRYKAQKATGKILDLTVGGKPVEPKRLYSVVTNEFVLGHASRLFGFDLGDREVTNLGWVDRELVLKAFRQEEVVSSHKDGRIKLE